MPEGCFVRHDGFAGNRYTGLGMAGFVFYSGFFGKIIRYRNNPFCEQLPMIDKIHGYPGYSIRFHYGVFEVKAAEYCVPLRAVVLKISLSLFISNRNNRR